MRALPSLRAVVPVGVALLTGCGSDLPPVPTEPTWSTESTDPTTSPPATAPTTIAVTTSAAVEGLVGAGAGVGAALPRTRRTTPVVRPRTTVTPPPAPLGTTTTSPPAPPPTTTSKHTTTTTPPPGSGVLFHDCDEARAAGAAPLHRGDAGYSSKLDRDGDGIACEPKPR